MACPALRCCVPLGLGTAEQFSFLRGINNSAVRFARTSRLKPKLLKESSTVVPKAKSFSRVPGLRWNPLAWYNRHLERNPVRTKCITSAVLFAVGDVIAQKVTAMDCALDVKRMGRAMVYGGLLLGPLSHVHFNFLEWLVVKKLAVRTSLVPFVKMFFDQFGYFSPITIAIYHVSMGMMEGLASDDIVKRLKEFYWPSLKACWTMWPLVMIVNFKLVPVQHQLNFVLAACIVWASVMSWIRASDAGRQVEAVETNVTQSRI